MKVLDENMLTCVHLSQVSEFTICFGKMNCVKRIVSDAIHFAYAHDSFRNEWLDCEIYSRSLIRWISLGTTFKKKKIQ